MAQGHIGWQRLIIVTAIATAAAIAADRFGIVDWIYGRVWR